MLKCLSREPSGCPCPGWRKRLVGQVGWGRMVFVSAAGLAGVLWSVGRLDLDIYLDAVRGWPGQSLYDYRDPRFGLPFNYPPFAAVLLLPLRTLERAFVDKAWLLLSIVGSVWFLAIVARMAPKLPRSGETAPWLVALEPGASRCSKQLDSARSPGCRRHSDPRCGSRAARITPCWLRHRIRRSHQALSGGGHPVLRRQGELARGLGGLA